MGAPGTPNAKSKWQAIKDQAAETADPDLADKVFNEERYAAAEEAKKPMIKFDCSLAGQILVDYRNEKSFTIEYWRIRPRGAVLGAAVCRRRGLVQVGGAQRAGAQHRP